MSKFPDFSAHGYQVIEQLGQNTQGGRVTYRAQDANGKQVAIKQFQVGGSWDGVKAIEREIRVLEDLKHRGIPAYIHSFKNENDMSFCLVTEYVNGRTLSAKRVFTADDVPRIIVQLLEILVYLQQCVPPIIHRDIKPENIMLDDELNVYLIDFGFARVGASANMSSVAAGSFGFMSPEQLRNLTLGKASDLYSLGMTLICMLGNIASSELGEYIDEKNQLDRKKVAPILSNYNPRLVLWLYNMVKPSAADRYVDAEQALDYLCQALQIKNPSNSRDRSQSLLNRSKESTHSQFNKIEVSTWIALCIMSAICVFDGKELASYASYNDYRRNYGYLLSVVSIIMISISPLVGSWLNGLEKQGKLEGFWMKICVVLVLAGVNVLAGTGVRYIVLANLSDFADSLYGSFVAISLSIVAGAGVGAAWGWAGTFAGAWVGAWARSNWGFSLYQRFFNGNMSWSVPVALIAGVAVVFASKKLLQSAGKWKAMMILLGTGLTGLGVGWFFVR